jgi:apolipoprotein N-acyltransferase
MRYRELLWRVPLALASGLVALYTFPTENVWILAPLIPGILMISILGLGFWWAWLLGFIAGQAFYISHIEWISLYLGPVPLLALSTLQSLYYAFGGAATAWLYRRMRPKGSGIILFGLAATSIWTLREYLANNFPYGGFPWSRLAMTQTDSFMNKWVFWGGMSLLSFMVALIGVLLALWVLNRTGRNRMPARPVFATIAIVALIPIITPTSFTTTEVGSKVIAAVQGNAKAGLFSNVEKGTILQNHLDATELVFDHPLAEQVDLLVWPENASDVDPLRSDSARAKIDELTNRIQAPFSFGTITARGDETFNSTLMWEPEVGPTDYYDKKVPVPFAEYAPDREFWRIFAPELVDMIPRGFSFGQRDGIFEVSPDFVAGTLICFEIAEDSILRELTEQNAGVILSQTNNADFGYSDETFQQAGIARLRAIETGRVVVNISTVGLSAIYMPSGEILSEVQWYTPAAMVEEVPLYSGLTPAIFIGSVFDYVNGAVVITLMGLTLARKQRRR